MRGCYRSRLFGTGRLVGLLVFLLIAISINADSSLAEAPYPRYGTRVVDGDVGDWNLAKDYFASMYRAGNPDKPLESSLYLRYDCPTNTLYVLVLGKPNVPVVVSDEDAWVGLNAVNAKLVDGSSGTDGAAPDFAWVNITPGLGSYTAVGYEASISMMPGTYGLIVHVNVWNDNEEQTSATAGFTKEGVVVVVDCAVPVDETSWGRIKSLYR
jgi:hypothetical protein